MIRNNYTVELLLKGPVNFFGRLVKVPEEYKSLVAGTQLRRP